MVGRLTFAIGTLSLAVLSHAQMGWIPHPIRQDVLAQTERCALIGAREVFDTTTLTTGELGANKRQVELMLTDTAKQRNACFESLQQQLTSVSRTTVPNPTTPGETAQQWQAVLDSALPQWLELRKTYSTQQLNALLGDIQLTLAASNSVPGLMESNATRAFMAGELLLALELERRQLTLDTYTAQTALERAEVAMAQAHHHLAQAQTVMEHPETQNIALTLYQLHSHLAPAGSQIDIALGLLPTEMAETRRALTPLRARLRQSSSIVQQAADDARAGLFAADPQQFMTQQYDSLSRLSADIRTQLAQLGQLLLQQQ